MPKIAQSGNEKIPSPLQSEGQTQSLSQYLASLHTQPQPWYTWSEFRDILHFPPGFHVTSELLFGYPGSLPFLDPKNFPQNTAGPMVFCSLPNTPDLGQFLDHQSTQFRHRKIEGGKAVYAAPLFLLPSLSGTHKHFKFCGFAD